MQQTKDVIVHVMDSRKFHYYVKMASALINVLLIAVEIPTVLVVAIHFQDTMENMIKTEYM